MLTPLELHWLAGLLEGEGSFMKPSPSSPNCPMIGLQMTDEDIVSRAASYLDARYCCTHRGADRGWKPCYQILLKGKRAVYWMHLLRPLLGSRRQQQIDRALAEYRPLRRGLSPSLRADIVRQFHEGSKAKDLAMAYSITREHVYRLVRKAAS
jgi:hypothetical protein